MRCTAILAICGLLAAANGPAAALPAATARAVVPAAPAVPIALLTIADGAVTLVRGRMQFNAVEGLRLEPMDIVHTQADTRVARIEFANGAVLDLGPGAQVLLQPEGSAWPKERAATAYVAQGWAKLRAPAAAAGSALRDAGLASATLDMSVADGGVVLARVERNAVFAFVEAGRAQLAEHVATRDPRRLEIGEGHAYTRAATTDAGSATLRPTAAQMRDTPPALTDSLPRRAADWAHRAGPSLGEPRAVAESELALWLDGEVALRNSLRPRLMPALSTAANTHSPTQKIVAAKRQLAMAKAKAKAKANASAPLRTARLAATRLAGATDRATAMQPTPIDASSAPTLVEGLAPTAFLAVAAPAAAAPAGTRARARASP